MFFALSGGFAGLGLVDALVRQVKQLKAKNHQRIVT